MAGVMGRVGVVEVCGGSVWKCVVEVCGGNVVFFNKFHKRTSHAHILVFRFKTTRQVFQMLVCVSHLHPPKNYLP